MDNKEIKIQQKKYLADQRKLESEIKKLNKEVAKKEDELINIDSQIKALYAKFQPKDIEVPQYYPSLPWRLKICYVLGQWEERTITEIIEGLVNIDKSIDEKSAYQTVQKTLQRLIKDLIVIKIGRYNSKYKLNLPDSRL